MYVGNEPRRVPLPASPKAALPGRARCAEGSHGDGKGQPLPHCPSAIRDRIAPTSVPCALRDLFGFVGINVLNGDPQGLLFQH